MLRQRPVVLAAALILSFVMTLQSYATDYEVDQAHSSVVFHIDHHGLSRVYGMFTQGNGNFTLDGNNSSFDLTVKASSLTTGNEKRDNHLNSADFFNTKQFPELTLKSTDVKVSGDKYDITADLTILGKTRPVTFTLTQLGKTDDKTGLDGSFTIKRSEWGMTYGLGMVGDEVTIILSFEGQEAETATD